MIAFQIDHPDFNNEPSMISLFFEKFLIGSNNRCQLRFPDHENSIYLKATQYSDKFVVESLDDHFFILNNKKYKGTLKCKPGDIIRLGMASITILDIDLTKVNKKINFEERKKNFLKNHRELSQVITSLEHELLFSEHQSS